MILRRIWCRLGWHRWLTYESFVVTSVSGARAPITKRRCLCCGRDGYV